MPIWSFRKFFSGIKPARASAFIHVFIVFDVDALAGTVPEGL